MQTNIKWQKTDKGLPREWEVQGGRVGGRNYQDHKQTFEGDRYIHYLNWSDGLRRYKHAKTDQTVHFQHVHFILCW